MKIKSDLIPDNDVSAFKFYNINPDITIKIEGKKIEKIWKIVQEIIRKKIGKKFE